MDLRTAGIYGSDVSVKISIILFKDWVNRLNKFKLNYSKAKSEIENPNSEIITLFLQTPNLPHLQGQAQ